MGMLILFELSDICNSSDNSVFPKGSDKGQVTLDLVCTGDHGGRLTLSISDFS